mmetsp:Transcript_17410/g.32170  ORF Transcript_17410/g.32170 Transcript_17410/m.32170 type:complete len:275 (+) Transcript_17410:555-1379(+)
MTEAIDVAAAVADAVAAATNATQQQQQQPLGPPPPPLPPGWIMKQSRSNPGYYYYFHMDSGLVTWNPPVIQQVNATPDMTLPQTMMDEHPTTASSTTQPSASSQSSSVEQEANKITDSGAEDEDHSRASKRRKVSSSTTPSSSTQVDASSSSSGPAEVRVLHILKKHKDSRRPSSWRTPKITQTKEEAHEELQGLLEILQEEEGNPQELRATFEELARTESDCSSAKRGGDLGFFGRKKMQPAFEEASFGLQKGEMTKEIVDTSSGSHIILRIG